MRASKGTPLDLFSLKKNLILKDLGVLELSCFCRTRDGAQALVHARQVLFHCATYQVGMLELGTDVGFSSLVGLSTGCDMEPVAGLSEDSFGTRTLCERG